MSESINTHELDRIDSQMLDLFLERLSVVSAAGTPGSGSLESRTRNRRTLKAVADRSGDMERYTFRFFENMLELSDMREAELASGDSDLRREIESAMAAAPASFPQSATIACQGVEGGNSQAACDRLFPRGHLTFVKTFEAVFSAVESGLCQFGVIPVENSSNGSVRSVYEQLRAHNCWVVRSTRLCIRHSLLAKPGTSLLNITDIYSHEQALGQCSAYLSKLKGVTLHTCANTAVAAEIAASCTDGSIAAISAPVCGDLYGLTPLAEDIQDSDNNYTRFICISAQPVIYPGSSKLSLIVGLDNRPGALYETLSLFANMGINMTKLESYPMSGRNFEFMFLIDLEASVADPGVIAMLDDLKRRCREFRFLGNYSEV